MLGMGDLVAVDEDMPLLGAEVRKVHKRCGVVGLHPQHLSGGKRHQALAGLEHRKRAEKPPRVEFVVPVHPGRELSVLAIPCPRQCEARRRDPGLRPG